MKKTLIIMMMVLLSAFLFISCDDDLIENNSSNPGEDSSNPGGDSSNVPKVYTVTFSTGDDADTVEPQSVEKGKTAVRPETNPTKADYAFIGWVTENDGDVSFDFTKAITEDTTVYAEWKETSSQGLSYSQTGTEGRLSVAISTFSGDTLYIPGKATFSNGKSRAVFSNSIYTVDTVKASGFASTTSLENVYLPQSIVAIGDKAFKGCTKLSTIYYGGTTTEWKAIEKGTGWASGTILTKVICSDGEVTISSDETQQIKWTVTFIISGSTSETKDVFDGEKVTRPETDPTQNNKAFLGWVTTKDGTQYFNFDSEISADTTLYARLVNSSTELSYTDGSNNGKIVNCMNISSSPTELYVAGKINDRLVDSVSSNFIASSVQVVYLPQAIRWISDKGFTQCTSLKTIYYGGTMAAWKAVTNVKNNGTKWFANEFESVICRDGTLEASDF